jgi:hypothetical protein
MALEAGEAWTAEKIDLLGSSRDLDRLLESAVMGRRVRFGRGAAVAWDGDGKAVMRGPDDWILEDYDPKRDGQVHPLAGNVRAVFHYSLSDDGMTRIMEQLSASKGFRSLKLERRSGQGWNFEIRWQESGSEEEKIAVGNDPVHARMAVYRGALKAVLL